MTDIVFRKAVPEDAASLATLYEQLVSKETDVDALSRQLGVSPGVALVAENDEHEIVGTVYGVICPDTVGRCQPFMVIDNLVVQQAHRGRGIAKGLMVEMESLARASDCSLILLVSGAHRTEAHRLYERLDYSVPVRGFRKYLR